MTLCFCGARFAASKRGLWADSAQCVLSLRKEEGPSDCTPLLAEPCLYTASWALSWFGHGCTGQWMDGLVASAIAWFEKDALATGWHGSMDVIMV